MSIGGGEAELLKGLRSGDEAAFRQLVRRYEPVVASTVIGMLGPGDDADDVGQETFIRFYQSLHRYRGDASIATYLRRIAMNLSLNELKRRRRWFGRFGSRSTDAEPILDPAMSPGEWVESSEMRTVVQSALAKLNEKHRAVVVLRMLQGCSTRETAAALNLPEGTVLSRLARALKQLETDLSPYMREGLVSVPREPDV